MHDQMNTDLYEVLGVNESATAKEISKAYKTLARKLHPDVNPDDAEAEEKFKQVTAAYDVLGDEAKRAEYDQFRAMVGAGFSPGGYPGSGGPGGPAGGPGYAGSMEDLLSQLFGSGVSAEDFPGAGFGGGGFGGANVAGPTMMTTVTLDFVEAVRGTEVSLQTPTGPVPIAVPAGVDNHAKMLVRTDRGDLLVQFDVRPHDLFGRDGANLTLDVPVTWTEAALGTRVKVPTLDGGSVTLKLPAGTPSGRTLRVAGKGVQTADAPAGDLLVRITVHVPVELSDEQRTLVQSLAELDDPVDHPARLN